MSEQPKADSSYAGPRGYYLCGRCGHGTKLVDWYPAIVRCGKCNAAMDRAIPRGHSDVILLQEFHQYLDDWSGGEESSNHILYRVASRLEELMTITPNGRTAKV